MFFTLLLVTFLLAAVVSYFVATIFRKPLGNILQRIIKDTIASAWQKYLTFATYVVGISGGVRINQLEQYISPSPVLRGPVESRFPLELNAERWTIEVYRTIIETLQSIAWMYLVVFVCTLIAYVIVRASEVRHAGRESGVGGEAMRGDSD